MDGEKDRRADIVFFLGGALLLLAAYRYATAGTDRFLLTLLAVAIGTFAAGAYAKFSSASRGGRRAA